MEDSTSLDTHQALLVRVPVIKSLYEDTLNRGHFHTHDNSLCVLYKKVCLFLQNRSQEA